MCIMWSLLVGFIIEENGQKKVIWNKKCSNMSMA